MSKDDLDMEAGEVPILGESEMDPRVLELLNQVIARRDQVAELKKKMKPIVDELSTVTEAGKTTKEYMFLLFRQLHPQLEKYDGIGFRVLPDGKKCFVALPEDAERDKPEIPDFLKKLLGL